MIRIALLFLCLGEQGHGWWFMTNQTMPPDPPTWWMRFGEDFPKSREALEGWGSWTTTAWTSFRDATQTLDPTRWEYGLWLVVDTMVSFGGWAIFGNSWNGVRTGCRRLLQIGMVLTLCLAAHYVWAVCYPVVSILVGMLMAVIWVLRRVLRLVGTVFFYVQKYAGLAPEAADVDYVGPGTGAVPETSALRAFKRTGEQAKQVVVRRGTLTAVFNVGNDAQSIRTHGLYLPVEPDSVRGDVELVGRLKHVDRVHLCRNVACTEDGGEHFQEYGVVKKFNAERFQSAQAHGGALEAGRTLWSWFRTPEVSQGVHRLVGKIREYASESETEDVVHCHAGQIKWQSETGLECLAPSKCTAVGVVFDQLLHEDMPVGRRGERHRHLAKIGMLDSPGTEVGESMLEKFMERYAMGRDEGLREDQVRARLCREHLLGEAELLKELIKDGEEEQSRGQRGLTKFLNCWRKEVERERVAQMSKSDSDWSVIPGRSDASQASPEQAAPPIPTSLRAPVAVESPGSAADVKTPIRRTSTSSPASSFSALGRTGQGSGEIKIAPPGLYKNDRKAGTGEATEPMEHIARAIQSQTAELATLVRHQAEGGGSHPVGTVKGLNRQSEELVFLMRACGQYNIQVGAGEHGQSLANSLLAAQVGASTKLRAAGFRQKMTTRLAVGIAGPFWGTNEKYALSASDFLSFADAELDQFASEHKGNKGPPDQRPPPPVRFDEWVARVRRQTDVWCLVYGEEWRTVRASALDLLSQWHLAYPHRWPLAIVMDLWEELAWRLMEDFKDILRSLKKEIGRETLTLNGCASMHYFLDPTDKPGCRCPQRSIWNDQILGSRLR
eukprot:s974_g12.t1